MERAKKESPGEMRTNTKRDKENRKMEFDYNHMYNSSLNSNPGFLLYSISEMSEKNIVKEEE